MAYRGIQILLRYRKLQLPESSFLLGGCRSYSGVTQNVPEFSCKGITSFFSKFQNDLFCTHGNLMMLRQRKSTGLPVLFNEVRYASTQVKAPAQARQMGALRVSMTSPGIVYEPYTPREPISFWKRFFTREGWKRTKEDFILELKSAYAIAKLRKSGYSKKQFYAQAIESYKEINYLIAHGDKASLRKAVTEKMYSVGLCSFTMPILLLKFSEPFLLLPQFFYFDPLPIDLMSSASFSEFCGQTLKNDIKMRESMWSRVYWEMVEPVVNIRTLRARLIGVDRNDINKVFIQLTLEFVTKQKFEAYDADGKVLAGDKSKEILVRDIWVFEKSLFHQGAYWRLCGKIVL